jgi:hypothetical protein
MQKKKKKDRTYNNNMKKKKNKKVNGLGQVNKNLDPLPNPRYSFFSFFFT